MDSNGVRNLWFGKQPIQSIALNDTPLFKPIG